MTALLLFPLLIGGGVEHRIEGGDVIQVIRKLPFAVVVQSDGDLFFWQIPSTFTATEKGNRLEVSKAPQGAHTLTVKIVSIDWDAKKVTQADGKIEILIGQLPNPPPDPDDPDPPVPQGCQSLTGLAKDACGWCTTLVPQRSQAKRVDLANMFSELSQGLATGRWINYSQSNAWFIEQRGKILNTQQLSDDWAKFGSRLLEAIRPLTDAPRSEVIKFYEDIAKGLKG
jgi:hypothetical protein